MNEDYIVLIGVVCLSGIFIIFGIYLLKKAIYFKRVCTDTVEAKVVDKEGVMTGGYYVRYVVYEYEVAGKVYYARENKYVIGQPSVGKEVIILYNPNKPEEIRYANMFIFPLCYLIGGTAFLIVGVIAFIFR